MTSASSSPLHPCPGRDCSEQLGFDTLACRRHWYSLPPELRRRINRLWQHGPMSEYMAAREEAARILGSVA